jgi:two-component system response regulator CiaR
MTGCPIKVLLVEDNRADAHLIAELVVDTGLAVNTTFLETGEKALDFFRRGGQADFILLDLNLPGPSGHEIMRLLNERGNKTPVIVLTGSSLPADREQAERNGAIRYLVKPMNVEEMDRLTLILRTIFSAHT